MLGEYSLETQQKYIIEAITLLYIIQNYYLS